MTFSFDDAVAQALEVRTSGRWEALNDKIKALAAHPAPHAPWYVRTFGALVGETFGEFSCLEKAYEERHFKEVPLLAWRARNLLELSIWARYFSTSIENATRIYADAGRDARELFQRFADWGRQENYPEEWVDALERGRGDLVRRAADQGVDNLTDPFTRVEAAARECGLQEIFQLLNKLLSKFAHPTAMMILRSPEDDEGEKKRRAFCYGIGCLAFQNGIVALERVQFDPQPRADN